MSASTKGYKISVSFQDNVNGITVIGKSKDFLFAMYRDSKTGKEIQKIVGDERNLKAHDMYIDVQSTFRTFVLLFPIEKTE